MTTEGVTRSSIEAAAARLREHLFPTPLLDGGPLSERAFGEPGRLLLKPECLQRTGSFKIRGAYNKIALLPSEARARGVITYSSGNHAQAVAAAAAMLGARAVVVMPEDAVPVKVARTRALGAAVVMYGTDSLQRQERAEALATEHGWTIVPPFDDPAIVAGQGTIGLEILAEAPEATVVVVPVGGGGLIAGIASAVKALRPATRVVGVEPAGAADARESLRRDAIVEAAAIDTVADGLRNKRVGALNFAIMRRAVDEIVTVADDAILAAVRALALERKLVVEPSGAVAVAAALGGQIQAAGQVVAVVSGGNVDPALLARLLTED